MSKYGYLQWESDNYDLFWRLRTAKRFVRCELLKRGVVFRLTFLFMHVLSRKVRTCEMSTDKNDQLTRKSLKCAVMGCDRGPGGRSQGITHIAVGPAEETGGCFFLK